MVASGGLWGFGLALLAACQPQIPDGVFVCERDGDCPDAFHCRARADQADEGTRYCFASDTAAGSASEPDAGQQGSVVVPGGPSGPGPGPGGPSGPGPGALLVPARAANFASLGEPRGGPGVVLRDDGFEFGARQCTADGAVCVTGGLSP